MDLRGEFASTRHEHAFDVPVSPSTVSDNRNSDKSALRQRILEMRAQGRSYREIGYEVGLHHTRVWQIVREAGL